MFLKSLYLNNFRNYKNFSYKFENKKNIILGYNGSGKTSLLESIYLLSFFKSFRAPDSYIPTYGSEFYFIKGEIINHINRIIELSYSIKERKKKVKKDSKEIKNFSIERGDFNVVLFLLSDLNLIDGTPEIKRDFMDDLFSQIDNEYSKLLYNYNRILESRNFVLKLDNNEKFKNLETLNEIIVKYGSEIIFKRIQFLNEINEIFIKILKDFNIKNLDDVKIEYKCNIFDDILEDFNIEFIKTRYKNILEENLKKEIAMECTLFGPHRDNFIFKNKEGYDLKGVFSTGEKRIIATIFKFAQFFFCKK